MTAWPTHGPGNGFGDEETAWRTLEYFALTRVLIASGLILSVLALGVGSQGPAATPVAVVSVAYFCLAGLLAWISFYVRQRLFAQTAAQIAVDLLVISSLAVFVGGVRSGVVILYLLPLAGAALLLPTIAVFFVCALAVIALLIDSVLRALQPGGGDGAVFQAGVYGAALFAVAWLLRFLAVRLAAQERLAQNRGRVIENQLAINRLVIAQMEQGVIVVDRHTQVRANNRAARVQLGLGADSQLTGSRLVEMETLRPLTNAFMQWLAGFADKPDAPGDAVVALPELALRARFVRPRSATSDEFAIFLEDVGRIEERAQQLKLAAMGRLTAAIAHEIRNPLGAISHAAQLLTEDLREPAQRRLAEIVRENTRRLNRLVDDVLRAARREAPLGVDIDLAAFLPAWLEEFTRDRSLEKSRFRLNLMPAVRVQFEESHLRQVLYNLLDNALRYASGKPGSIGLVSERDEAGVARLWVLDDGPGVAQDAQAALFEPFFTTHGRGTGLGLYMAREFCIVNRSDLGYATRAGEGGGAQPGFFVRFAPSSEAVENTAGFLDTIPVS